MKTKGNSPFPLLAVTEQSSMLGIVFLMIGIITPSWAHTRAGNLAVTTSELKPFEAYFYKEGNLAQETLHRASQNQFNSMRSYYYELNLRIVDLEIEAKEGTLAYSAIFESGSGNEIVDIDLSWDALMDLYPDRLSSGYELRDLETYQLNGIRYYAAVWSSAQGANQILIAPSSLNLFLAQVQEYGHQGYTISDLETFESQNRIYYFANLDFTNDPTIFIPGLSWNEFHAEFHGLNASNYRLLDFDSYTINGTAYYNGVWQSGTQEDKLAVIDPLWDKTPIEDDAETKGLILWDFELILEHPNKESFHNAQSAAIRRTTKMGLVNPDDPNGTLMPLHNGSSSGPGN